VQTIDTRPQSLAILHYGGDTLILNITTASDYSTASWNGQIRLTHSEASPDATFSIEPDSLGAIVTLSSTDSAALNALGVDVTENGQTFKRYSGVFDIQIAEDGVVNTLVRGTITVDSDVTKVL
jgi:hypothetical protein